MEISQSSQSSKSYHSTPKSKSSLSASQSSQSQSRSAHSNKKENDNSISEMMEKGDYSDTFQNSVHSSGNPSASPRVKNSSCNMNDTGESNPSASSRVKNSSCNMNDTGESTRSLLSVLSHSSVDSLSTGSLTDSSTTSSPARKGTESQINNPYTDSTLTKEKESTLSPWENWLIEKAKLERKKVREEVRAKLAELKAKEEEEVRNKERRRVIEGQVVEWLKEKVKQEKLEKARDERKKRNDQKEKIIQKQKTIEKEKVKRQEWLSKKETEEKKRRQEAQEEKRQRALEERMRKEKADEAFKIWKKQARRTPTPATGSFYDRGNIGGSLHSGPTYYNPKPWMPIEIPTASRSVKCSGSSAKRKNGKRREDQCIQSPPLLFRDRSKQDNFKSWGRPR